MIELFATWVKPELAKRIGVRLITAREAMTRTVPTESVIILDRVRGEGTESIASPMSAGTKIQIDGVKGGPIQYIRAVAISALFLGVSSRKGATFDDHSKVVDAMVDAFLCACDYGVRANRSLFNVSEGGMLAPVDESDSSPQAGFAEVGARYLMKFSIGRGVIDLPVGIADLSTASVSSTTTTTSLGQESTE